MKDLPELMSKKAWFALFNLGSLLYMIVSGSLHWEWLDLVSFGIALLLMNGIAWISARRYKDWKW